MKTAKINGLPVPTNLLRDIASFVRSGALDNAKTLDNAVHTIADLHHMPFARAAELWLTMDPMKLRRN